MHNVDYGPEGSNRQDGRSNESSDETVDEVARRGAPGRPEGGAELSRDSTRTRYFDLYDLAPVGYCTLNPAGQILLANRTAASLLRAAQSALVGESVARFVAADDAAAYAKFHRRLVESGEAQSCELRIVPAAPGSDAPLWVHLSAAAAEVQGAGISDGDAAPEYRLVLTDVSQRRAAEEELREQKEFFHLIAENIGDFIAVLDLDGRRIYNSPSYLNFFGARRDLHGTNSFAEVRSGPD